MGWRTNAGRIQHFHSLTHSNTHTHTHPHTCTHTFHAWRVICILCFYSCGSFIHRLYFYFSFKQMPWCDESLAQLHWVGWDTHIHIHTYTWRQTYRTHTYTCLSDMVDDVRCILVFSPSVFFFVGKSEYIFKLWPEINTQLPLLCPRHTVLVIYTS